MRQAYDSARASWSGRLVVCGAGLGLAATTGLVKSGTAVCEGNGDAAHANESWMITERIAGCIAVE
ncbi:MAG: hypothetical protein A2603_17220 [Bdellovibrionales bacterium RIFOXYD1_FULL_55_31]|nr:MAG: hypothetical protein A2603_17220 [Bdellovibrionales bacterium RIFOXYD1_FULL_55_31]